MNQVSDGPAVEYDCNTAEDVSGLTIAPSAAPFVQLGHPVADRVDHIVRLPPEFGLNGVYPKIIGDVRLRP